MLLRNKDSTTDIDTCVTKQIDTTTDKFGFQLLYLDCVLDTLLIDTKEFTYYMGSDANKFLIFFRLTKESNPTC